MTEVVATADLDTQPIRHRGAFAYFDLDEEAKSRSLFQILREDGSADEIGAATFDQARCRRLYEDMLTIRVVDARMMALQRQGRTGFYGEALGQEAAVVGSASASLPDDWIVPALREAGVGLTRGMTLDSYIAQIFGNSLDPTHGRQMPCHPVDREHHYVVMSSCIATQIPHAVGIAMAMKARGDRGVCVFGYMGDGATSEGDFHVAMNFAGVYKAPVVLICQNNQWAISTPGAGQTASETIAIKGLGYGLESLRADGNDVFAVHEVCRYAAEKARRGGGATFIELLTYRVGAHSSSDDPTRYRDESITEVWKARRDPLHRLRIFLEQRGWLATGEHDAMAARLEAQVREVIARVEAAAPPPIDSLIEDVFEEPTWLLREQLAALLGENEMSELRVDALVIGAGPGGYPCGIRLGQLKVKTAVVEREYWGGVCLNVGCIPSKAVIHAAKTFEKIGHADELGITVGKPTLDMTKLQAWKGGVVSKLTGGVKTLLKGNGVQLVEGKARLEKSGPDGHRVMVEGPNGKQMIIARSVVIATGSRPMAIPGFTIDQQRIIDSTGALALDHVPNRLVVIGGGYIGLELGMVYAKFGSKVTVVEAMPNLLGTMDKDCVGVVARKLRKMGVEVMLEAKAKSWEDKGDRAVLTVEGKDGKLATIDADKILLAVGRRPNTEDLGLEVAGVKVDKRGYIVADDQLRTSVPNIYAIGDVIGGMMLAHKATKEGETLAEIIAGHKAAVDVRCIPAVVFTDPEVAVAGLTEDEARAKGHEIKVGKFPFAALGRALSVNDTDGFAKVICDAKTEEVLGVHIAGNGAGDLISEAALAIEMGAVVQDLNLTVHPHPTLSEAVREAAAAAIGEAVHIINR